MTEVPLELQPYESLFVVFPKKGALESLVARKPGKAAAANFPELRTAQEIDGACR